MGVLTLRTEVAEYREEAVTWTRVTVPEKQILKDENLSAP